MSRDQDLFTEFCSDLDELAETHLIQKFLQGLNHFQEVNYIFPNNKPWMSKSVKNIIDERTTSFNQREFDIIMIN